MGDILFLAHRVPFPPDRGDKIRSHHLLKALAGLGRVHVGTFAENEQDRAQDSALAEISATHCMPMRDVPLALAGAQALLTGRPVSLTAFFDRDLANWVAHTLAEHPVDTIVVFSSQMGQYVPDDFNGRVIVDLCDVDSAKFATYAEDGGFPRSLLYRREARLLAREEARLARRADTTLLITENEADLLRGRPGTEGAAIRALGNGVDTDIFDPAAAVPHSDLAGDSLQLVFTGQMDYPPNIAAVERFARAILPRIRASRAAEFHIVGRAPTAAVLGLAEIEGVTVWGEVPDVRPFLRGADAVVAPLLLARGVQNKVLEAMAMARPVLVSREAATGIPAEDGRHWRICPDDAAFVDAALQIAAVPETAEMMGVAARRFVRETLGWDAIEAELARILDRGEKACDHAA